jgi:hypothetical protein
MGHPDLFHNAQTNNRIVKASTRLSATLGILTGSLMFAGSLPAANVIVNGSFEENNGFNGTNTGFGWVSANGFADVFDVYSHTNQVWYDGDTPADAGDWYFHTVGLGSLPDGGIAEQSITLSDFASSANIDAGNATYDFSAQIAGYNVAGDTAILELVFLDAASSQVGSTVTLDGTTGGADGITNTWSLFSSAGTVPTNAQTARVQILQATAGTSNGNDNYVDLVALDITAIPEPSTFMLGSLGLLGFLLRRR